MMVGLTSEEMAAGFRGEPKISGNDVELRKHLRILIGLEKFFERSRGEKLST